MKTTNGFSIVELLIAMAIMITFGGTLISLLLAGESVARVQPEAGDLQQRARVVTQTLRSDLNLAGTGLEQGPQAGSLARFFPAIVPSGDSAFAVWYLSNRDAQSTLAAPLAAGLVDVTLRGAANCLGVQPACAFTAGTTAVLFDSTGCRDVVRIDAVSPDSLQLRSPAVCAYAAGAAIAQANVWSYRVDPVAHQLLRRDEATLISAPVADGVASLHVDYFADATGAGALPLAGFSDGPWAGGVNIFDTDLLRVRRVRVTVRLETTDTALRGSDPVRFLHPGSATNSRQMLPDRTVTFEVAPPNLHLAR